MYLIYEWVVFLSRHCWHLPTGDESPVSFKRFQKKFPWDCRFYTRQVSANRTTVHLLAVEDNLVKENGPGRLCVSNLPRKRYPIKTFLLKRLSRIWTYHVNVSRYLKVQRRRKKRTQKHIFKAFPTSLI